MSSKSKDDSKKKKKILSENDLSQNNEFKKEKSFESQIKVTKTSNNDILKKKQDYLKHLIQKIQI